ncbi:helix-turn-helix domain-containing protein [Streptomyces sp. GKU 257-1]|nr:helix-turn-helix domain-containing protein [Streptomyces sp. GKU 257-1]
MPDYPGPLTRAALARRYSVERSTITRVLQQATSAHAEDPSNPPPPPPLNPGEENEVFDPRHFDAFWAARPRRGNPYTHPVRISRTVLKRSVRLNVRVTPDLDFPAAARALGGRRTRTSPHHHWWQFDARQEPRVRQVCARVFGTDGTWEKDRDLVAVRWRIDWSPFSDSRELWLAGRFIAGRYERDETVTLGWGVIVAEGGFHDAGGSRKNPRINPVDNTVLEIQDLPRAAVEAEQNRPVHSWETKELTVIETGPPAPSTGELRRRREELLHELATLNTLLDQRATAPAAPRRCRCGRHECPPEGYTVTDVARLAHRSPNTITEWCRTGALPAVRTGGQWTILPPLPDRVGRTTIARPTTPDTHDSED